MGNQVIAFSFSESKLLYLSVSKRDFKRNYVAFLKVLLIKTTLLILNSRLVTSLGYRGKSRPTGLTP